MRKPMDAILFYQTPELASDKLKDIHNLQSTGYSFRIRRSPSRQLARRPEVASREVRLKVRQRTTTRRKSFRLEARRRSCYTIATGNLTQRSSEYCCEKDGRWSSRLPGLHLNERECWAEQLGDGATESCSRSIAVTI